MFRVGILSDTHGYLHPGVTGFFSEVNEIWHAGDIGTIDVLDALNGLKPVRAVYGNIDGREVRHACPEIVQFAVEGVSVVMTHIGGYPGRYAPGVRAILERSQPRLFVCGHSHILKVMYDRKLNLLHVNPGSAGKYGFHKSITAVRLVLDGIGMRDLEVLDIPKKEVQ